MSFNLRFASDRPPNAWPDRRPVMRNCIREVNPDVIGTQEGLYQQLKDLARDLPDYRWIGEGREGGSKSEFMAVFYRAERLEPLEYEHFWLSDTPNVVGSTTWGNSNRRMVTWIRFLDKTHQKQFYLWNTHLDHQIQTAREKSAELIRKRVEALPLKLPIFLIGDFNAIAGTNKAYHILVNDQLFTDTWNVAKQKLGGPIATFHGYKPPVMQDQRIDWILFKGEVQVDAVQVLTCSQNGQYPSDHFPVMSWVSWSKDH